MTDESGKDQTLLDALARDFADIGNANVSLFKTALRQAGLTKQETDNALANQYLEAGVTLALFSARNHGRTPDKQTFLDNLARIYDEQVAAVAKTKIRTAKWVVLADWLADKAQSDAGMHK